MTVLWRLQQLCADKIVQAIIIQDCITVTWMDKSSFISKRERDG